MKSRWNKTAWLPCLVAAAGLPAIAAAQQPTAVVEQLDADAQVAQTERDTRATATDPAQRDTRRHAGSHDQSVDDARLEARVETTIALNRSLQRSDIQVKVEDSTVTLTGTVDDDLHRQLAEELAMNVEGVDSVDNELEVDEEFAGPARGGEDADGDRRTFAQTVEDATTTTAVRSRLLWSRNADGVNTEVETRNGHVTLSGTAESEEAKRMAESLARNAWGVTAVTNNITVAPEDGERTASRDEVAGTESGQEADDDGNAMSDAWITTKVRSSFLTSRWISGRDIDIETNDGVVELSGELDSAAERDLAIEVAENIRGVNRVDARNLTVIS